jgi:hypothetical protein
VLRQVGQNFRSRFISKAICSMLSITLGTPFRVEEIPLFECN